VQRYRFTRQFEKSFAKLPEEAVALFERKLPLFLENIHHPSFRTKEIEGFKNPYIRDLIS
jgi:mRNA-degrading endonuclease RelE of RelBE toxin-antitoxin system